MPKLSTAQRNLSKIGDGSAAPQVLQTACDGPSHVVRAHAFGRCNRLNRHAVNVAVDQPTPHRVGEFLQGLLQPLELRIPVCGIGGSQQLVDQGFVRLLAKALVLLTDALLKADHMFVLMRDSGL